MSYEFFLALRYFSSRRRRPLGRATALAAVVGIAFGVAALIVALALANGFRDEMRDKILRGTAHISVTRADGQPMPDYPTVTERIRNVDEVTGAYATTYDGAVLSGPGGSAYAVLRGIDDKSGSVRVELQRTLIEGSIASFFESAARESRETKLPGVIIGADLAKRAGLHVGEVAEIIPANASLAKLAPVYRHVQVAGIFRSGLFEYDSTWIYLPLETAAAFAGTTRAATVISVEVRDIYDVKRIAANLRAALGNGYTTMDWQEVNRQLFTALALERRMGFFIIALIILIAALNITTTLVLVVVERQSDIAILGAMGATGRSIMSIFLIEGGIIGAIGAAIGVVVGTAACFVGNHYQLVRLPADVYSIGNVPFNAHLRDVLMAALVAFLLSLLATIYPARAAARVRPVEILREN
jgi:lipoprotein-releasing system permease protein